MKNTLKVILSVILTVAFVLTSIGFTTVPVKSIKLDKSNISLKAGQSYTLKVTITPSNATNKSLTFSSGNKNIATVDKNGKIKGVKAGKTVITVTSSFNKKIIARCNVTVSQVKQALKMISFPYTGPQITFKGLWADLGQKPGDSMPIVAEWKKKLGNIKFEFELLPWADYDTKQKLYLSSGEVPDYMVTRDVVKTISTYGPNLIFYDWAPLLDKYMPNIAGLRDTHTAIKLLTNAEGKMYGLPPSLNKKDWAMEGWWYNETVLNKYNIKTPETKDEFLDAMRKVKAADPKIIPFLNPWKMGYLMSAMANMWDYNDRSIQWNRELQKWEFGPFKPGSNLKEYLQFLNVLWKEKLINPEINTATDEQVWAKMQKGEWAFSYYYHGMIADNWTSKGVKLGWTAKSMPCPKGKDGKAYGYVTVPYDGDPYWGITSSAKIKEPEIFAQFMNFCFSDEITVLKNWGIEGVTFRKNADGKLEYLPEVKIMTNPNGVKTLKEYGMGQIVELLPGFGDVDAQKLQGYDKAGINAEKLLSDSFNSGRVIPVYKKPSPVLTEDEAGKVSAITNPINTYLDESYNKFIMGDMSFDQWDGFLAKIKTLGDIDYVVNLYNSKPQYVLKGTWERK